ncbi:MAG: FAD-binding oxidoreductase [Bdellovibrionales bacterium]|nr:FAD-binding oxidoreductase [Bdellovibrionales bacterium]
MKKIDSFLTEVATILSSEQIRSDPDSILFHAQDWSQVLTPNASAILFPTSTDEVSKIVKSASRHQIPIVPSGGRTGLSGGAVATNGEVVLSLTGLNFIGPIHEGALTLRAGAGAITEAVHKFCEPQGLTWPVDFASKGSSTVGGNIATNAGGIRVIRYGNTRNWVLGLTLVTMDGTIHTFNSELEKNNTGYDLRQLMIGSEGTLGIITEATLKLAPIPHETQVLLFSLKGFPELIEFFNACRKNFPELSAFECMDHESLESVTEHFRVPFPMATKGTVYALMEVENTSIPSLEARLEKIMEAGLILDAVIAQNGREKKSLWKYREGVAESILHGSSVHQEDVSVPVAMLPEFYSTIQKRYQEALPGWSVYFFGHIGDGNLHIFIKKPENMSLTEFQKHARNSDHELFQILKRYNGSVSAEHGIGILKRHALHFTRSEPELEIMKGIKKTFDPNGLLNPGKIFS